MKVSSPNTTTVLKAQTGILWLKRESRASLCSELQRASWLESVQAEAALGALAQWPQWHFRPYPPGLLSASSYCTVLYSTRCIFTLRGHPDSPLFGSRGPCQAATGISLFLALLQYYQFPSLYVVSFIRTSLCSMRADSMDFLILASHKWYLVLNA